MEIQVPSDAEQLPDGNYRWKEGNHLFRYYPDQELLIFFSLDGSRLLPVIYRRPIPE